MRGWLRMMNLKLCGIGCSWPVLKYYPRSFLERLSKITMGLSQCNKSKFEPSDCIVRCRTATYPKATFVFNAK